jgi:hypothetical protein
VCEKLRFSEKETYLYKNIPIFLGGDVMANSLLIHTRAWSAAFSTPSETSRLGRSGRGLQRNQKTHSEYHSEWKTHSLVTMEVHLLITKYHAKSQKSKYQLGTLQNEDWINTRQWGNLITLLKIQMQLTSIKCYKLLKRNMNDDQHQRTKTEA